MRLNKGDCFTIDIDAAIANSIEYFKDRMPIIAKNAQKTWEPLRNKIFRVHRTESYGEVIIFEHVKGEGFTGVMSKFCKRYETKTT